MASGRVVVTGIGAVTPLGPDITSTWDAVVAGKSGITPITSLDVSAYPTQIAGQIPDFDPSRYLTPKARKGMDRFAQLFVTAVGDALADSGIPIEPERTGVVAGNGMGGAETLEAGIQKLIDGGARKVSPRLVPNYIHNAASAQAAMRFNLLGPNMTICTACASSANAIGEGAEIIRRGDADVMVVGGTEAVINYLTFAAIGNTRALSIRNDDPEGACRPFDADRDGFVLSEGAAAMTLESYESAHRRDATVYGELLGYGLSSDAFHMVAPRPGGDGPSRAMTQAMTKADLAPWMIDYINAHGSSTQRNDANETLAIKTVLRSDAHAIPVSSTKSCHGHLIGAAGALEAMLSLLAMRDDVIPPTINYETPDPDCDLDYVPNEARDWPINAVMTNSFGFGGHNVSLIFGRV